MMTAPGGTLEIKGWLGRKTVVTPDAIEITHNGQTQRIPKNFIKGYRTASSRSFTVFTLDLLNEPKPIKFNVANGRAGQMRAALSGVQDLDAADRAAAEEAIRNDEAFGTSREERAQTLQNERRLALIVNCVCGLIAAWALIFPYPYALSVIVCAASGPLALALTYVKQARWYLVPRKNDPHPSVAIGVFASALGVGLKALLDVSVLDWSQLWLIAVLGGLVLTAAVLAIFNAAQIKYWPAAFVGVAYLFGVVAQADALLDSAPGETFQAQVISTYVSHGRSTSYSATLGPWGPETTDNTHDVSPALYAHLSFQREACVTLHPGALHLRWYAISTCDGLSPSGGNAGDKGK
jgi:hypothetical protein